MDRAKPPRQRALAAAIIAAIALVWLIAAYFILKPQSSPAPAMTAAVEERLSHAKQGLSPSELSSAQADALSYSLSGQCLQQYRSARQDVTLSYLDPVLLSQGLEIDMQLELEAIVGDAALPSDVYDDSGEYLPSVLTLAYERSVSRHLEEPSSLVSSQTLSLQLVYRDHQWQLKSSSELEALLSAAVLPLPGFEEACQKLEPVEFRYKLRDWTSPGPVPNPSLYGETDDPNVINQLLQEDAAKKLIAGQSLAWDPEADFIPGTLIRYYLDETILSIVWQENEHGAVGTFAETFIGDPSQLRRKIAGDSFGAQEYYVPTQLAVEANAVLGVSGDFYDIYNRIYGVYAYNGQVLRSRVSEGECCYFTTQGDMIFSASGQFADADEAQKFVTENDVVFSLSFGPILLDHGVDVTPNDYPLGEILDTYARCCIGQLGRLHYLAMTINCQEPYFGNLVTLRQAADSMIAHGCYNAYTLDGGQTGSIVFGNQLINPVQFGVQREMSDIFYFATALPS